jgi:hypothetical protein
MDLKSTPRTTEDQARRRRWLPGGRTAPGLEAGSDCERARRGRRHVDGAPHAARGAVASAAARVFCFRLFHGVPSSLISQRSKPLAKIASVRAGGVESGNRRWQICVANAPACLTSRCSTANAPLPSAIIRKSLALAPDAEDTIKAARPQIHPAADHGVQAAAQALPSPLPGEGLQGSLRASEFRQLLLGAQRARAGSSVTFVFAQLRGA